VQGSLYYFEVICELGFLLQILQKVVGNGLNTRFRDDLWIHDTPFNVKFLDFII
jgi:hypothetical protein